MRTLQEAAQMDLGAAIGKVSFSTEWLPSCRGEVGEFPGCQHT